MADYPEDMMTMMMPDILVVRMEQVRKLIKDLKDADVVCAPLLIDAIDILLQSCEFKEKPKITHGGYDNITPLN